MGWKLLGVAPLMSDDNVECLVCLVVSSSTYFHLLCSFLNHHLYCSYTAVGVFVLGRMFREAWGNQASKKQSEFNDYLEVIYLIHDFIS